MNTRSNQKLNDLPPSDNEFWEGDNYSFKARPIKICKTHGKKWMAHIGYIDNHGEVTCKWCPWGTRIAGYLKVLNGRIIDLRSLNRK